MLRIKPHYKFGNLRADKVYNLEGKLSQDELKAIQKINPELVEDAKKEK